MDTVTYPEIGDVPGVAPVRLNVMKERDAAKRLDARWTPTFIFMDAQERQAHRFMGYHPPAEFVAQVQLARGHAGFAFGDTAGGLAALEAVEAPEFKPEAMYWAGVCRFKLEKSTQPIYDACREIVEKYPDHFWAKKVGFVTKYRDFNIS